MSHAANQVKIAEGQINLYQRDDVKDGVWQCRMNLKGHKGYVRRSTGETDLDRAKERSLQILGELNQRQSQNLPISRKTSLSPLFINEPAPDAVSLICHLGQIAH